MMYKLIEIDGKLYRECLIETYQAKGDAHAHIYILDPDEIPYVPNSTKGNFLCLHELEHKTGALVTSVGNCSGCRRIIASTKFKKLPQISLDFVYELYNGYTKFVYVEYKRVDTGKIVFDGSHKFIPEIKEELVVTKKHINVRAFYHDWITFFLKLEREQNIKIELDSNLLEALRKNYRIPIKKDI